MADTKISALTALTQPVNTDLLPLVDVSDTTMAASGTTKKITLADLGIPVVNVVTQYGVVVGTSDQASKFQSAIDDVAAAGGGMVFVPPTSNASGYRVSILQLKSKVWLCGAGRGSQIRSIDNNTTGRFILTGSGADDVQYQVSDLYITCTNASQSGATIGGISIDHSGTTLGSSPRHHRFWNLLIAGFTGNGVHLKATSASNSFYFSKVSPQSNSGHGFIVDSGSTDHIFESCYPLNNGLTGMDVTGHTNRFVSCKIGNSGQVDATTNGDGIRVVGNYCTFAGCEAQGNLRHGFNFDGGDRNVMVGSQSNMNTKDAFRLNNAVENYVHGVANEGSGAFGPHDHILDMVGTSTGNDLEITYSAGALVGGHTAVNGSTASNQADVRQIGSTTSAYTVTNPTTDRALNVTGDTLAQGHQVLGTLITDLQARGVIG